MRLLPALAAPLLLLLSCSDETPHGIAANINPETTPTMLTHQVETLISDSGVTRYRMTAPVWMVFDEAKVPTWRFPKGIHLEKFDELLKPMATIDADSATYFKQDQTWRLDGNVRIANLANEKFLTNQLFWNQRDKKVYSDSFIHIERPDRILEGYGFEANERMTSYNIRNVSGIFPTPKRGAEAPAATSAPAPAPSSAPSP